MLSAGLTLGLWLYLQESLSSALRRGCSQASPSPRLFSLPFSLWRSTCGEPANLELTPEPGKISWSAPLPLAAGIWTREEFVLEICCPYSLQFPIWNFGSLTLSAQWLGDTVIAATAPAALVSRHCCILLQKLSDPEAARMVPWSAGKEGTGQQRGEARATQDGGRPSERDRGPWLAGPRRLALGNLPRHVA